jgi:hypothetical protein
MVGLGVYFLVKRHLMGDEQSVTAAPGGWLRDLTLGFSMVGFNPSVMVNWLALLIPIGVALSLLLCNKHRRQMISCLLCIVLMLLLVEVALDRY